jgi:LPXTG-motif cell wall-anchored protein
VFRKEQTSLVACATLLYAIRSPSGILAVGSDRTPAGRNARQAGDNMDTNTLLIILVVLLVLGGGGFFYRRRV